MSVPGIVAGGGRKVPWWGKAALTWLLCFPTWVVIPGLIEEL